MDWRPVQLTPEVVGVCKVCAGQAQHVNISVVQLQTP